MRVLTIATGKWFSRVRLVSSLVARNPRSAPRRLIVTRWLCGYGSSLVLGFVGSFSSSVPRAPRLPGIWDVQELRVYVYVRTEAPTHAFYFSHRELGFRKVISVTARWWLRVDTRNARSSPTTASNVWTRIVPSGVVPGYFWVYLYVPTCLFETLRAPGNNHQENVQVGLAKGAKFSKRDSDRNASISRSLLGQRNGRGPRHVTISLSYADAPDAVHFKPWAVLCTVFRIYDIISSPTGNANLAWNASGGITVRRMVSVAWQRVPSVKQL